jgi:hypothetical protein
VALLALGSREPSGQRAHLLGALLELVRSLLEFFGACFEFLCTLFDALLQRLIQRLELFLG